ncbi:5-hydroxytryptamine receptor 1B [Holothuria leucospilota]|uniref:5-hydroxytryptamine receptor 1B n=1 Tax=Holothuria leucospilota TaxID=206669 RepID=A0A9Q1CJ59_HOLLE|nr:5-hydroxytryptamine receptor 1B [Holothuria leucospilota]
MPGLETTAGGVSLDNVSEVLCIIFGILGLFGNGLVLVVMVRIRSLRTITNLFIANQSIIDFLSSIFLLILLYKPPVFDYSDWEINGWTMFVCKIWQSQYIFWSLMSASTTNLILLTLERWIAVVFPIVYRNRVTWKRATVIVFVPWIYGFVFELYWQGVHHVVDGVCSPSFRNQSLKIFTGICVFLAKLIMPVLIMLGAYISILQRIRPQLIKGEVTTTTRSARFLTTATNSAKAINFDIGEPTIPKTDRDAIPTTNRDVESGIKCNTFPRAYSDITSSQTTHQERIRLNILKTLFLVTVVYILCWSPALFDFLIYNLGAGRHTLRGSLHRFFVVLIFVNIWSNPVIYTFKYRRFQDGLRKTFCIFRKKSKVASHKC